MYGNESYGGVLYTASFEDIMSLPSFIANFNGGGLDFAEWPSRDRCLRRVLVGGWRRKER